MSNGPIDDSDSGPAWDECFTGRMGPYVGMDEEGPIEPSVTRLSGRLIYSAPNKIAFTRAIARLRPLYSRINPDGTIKLSPKSEIHSWAPAYSVAKALGRNLESIESLVLSYADFFRQLPQGLPEDMRTDWRSNMVMDGFAGCRDLAYLLTGPKESGLEIDEQVTRAVNDSLGDALYEEHEEFLHGVRKLIELYVQATISGWTAVRAEIEPLIDLMAHGFIPFGLYGDETKWDPEKPTEHRLRAIFFAA